jgi:hypothetical protein
LRTLSSRVSAGRVCLRAGSSVGGRGFEGVEQHLFHVVEGAGGHALLDERFDLRFVHFDAYRGFSSLLEYVELVGLCKGVSYTRFPIDKDFRRSLPQTRPIREHSRVYRVRGLDRAASH